LLRHAQSSQSIPAFCEDEAISTAASISGVPRWHVTEPAHPPNFIDLGAIKNTVGRHTPTGMRRCQRRTPGIDVLIAFASKKTLTWSEFICQVFALIGLLFH
jgi:hypothetical protein